jgi:hypothetical protein
MNNSNVSAGVSFLQAAENGIAKSVGERLRSATMNDLLMTAIKTKMAFMPDDAGALRSFSITSSVGVFRPLDESFYRQACLSGGSYAQMWEKSHNVKPIKAARAGTSTSDVQTEIRVAAGIAVFLVGDDTDPLMPRHEGLQVWWVTSINLEAGIINLGRYKLRLDQRYPFNRFDAPAKRKKLNREQWDEAQMLVRSTLLSVKSAA